LHVPATCYANSLLVLIAILRLTTRSSSNSQP
jgi:hypothetical protein